MPCWAAFQAHIVLVSRGVYRVPFFLPIFDQVATGLLV